MIEVKGCEADVGMVAKRRDIRRRRSKVENNSFWTEESGPSYIRILATYTYMYIAVGLW